MELVVDIDIYENNYFVNMEKCPYDIKSPQSTIYIKPVNVKDYNVYQWAKGILDIEKNTINDIDIIQMSYLKFITTKMFEMDENSKHKLWWILYLCLGEEYWAVGNNCLIICEEDSTVKYVISAKEFDDIRRIILFYNDVDYDEQYVSPEVKELAQTYYKAQSKNIVSPSFEKRKAYVSGKTNRTFQELNTLTIREFDLIYKSCLDSERFLTDKIIQASYKYDVKENVVHPLFRPKEDPYAELFTSTSTLSAKGVQGAENIGMNLP